MELALFSIIIGLGALLWLMHYVARASSGLNQKHFKAKWSTIEKTYKTPDIGPKMAVIEADKLLDQALKQRRISGDSMGERLRSAEKHLKNYNSVWEAHKLRNRLVHEDVKLKKSQAQAALSSFRNALKGLGAL